MDYDKLKAQMVDDQIARRGIDEERVLAVFRKVERHLFVPSRNQSESYDDHPLPIGQNQTISQPYIVALMTQLLDLKPGMKVLEIGTGSGYQTAVLCCLGGDVYTVERIPELAESAHQRLSSLGYRVRAATADGSLGWPEHAPYDRIIVTAASPAISDCWRRQLVTGGRIVVPLGGVLGQGLIVGEKVSDSEITQRKVCGCVFVPLIGEHGYKK